MEEKIINGINYMLERFDEMGDYKTVDEIEFTANRISGAIELAITVGAISLNQSGFVDRLWEIKHDKLNQL